MSRFAELPEGGGKIELMTAPWLEAPVSNEHLGWDHVDVSLGRASAVDELAARCASEGRLVSAPGMIGDGYYEAVIAMPDGTRIEVTA